MTGTPWVDGLFAAAFALVGLYSVSRMVLGRRHGGIAGELAHVLMAAGMVAMFAPSVDPFPPAVWIGLFAVDAAWLIAALPRAAGANGVFAKGERHRLHPVISAAAMVYMFAAMGAPAAGASVVASPASGASVLAHDHGAGGGVNLGPLTMLLAVYFLAHAVWSAGQMTRVSAATGAVAIAPWPAGLCPVVMGLGMSYMLAMMVS